MSSIGKLILVPTPIGNLDDITLRAIKVLQTVDFILAEDTRTSIKLIKHLSIEKKLVAYHKFNEHKATQSIVAKIKNGQTVALISDAGTPTISDPGFLLTRACIENNIDIECLPGATAFVPALAVSGLPNHNFIFEGFLPQKKGRQTKINNLIAEQRTMIFYESPHRLVKALTQFEENFGEERQACVCREMTKLYEEIKRGTLTQLKTYYTNNPPKGEIVIVVAGVNKKQRNDD